MSVSRTFERSYTPGNGGGVLGYQKVVADESEVSVSKSIPDETTDMEIIFAVPYAQIKAILLASDQAITVEVNSSSAPDQIFTLLANQPLLWLYGDPIANPITQDITKLYITNASGAAAALEVRAILDATP